MANSIDLAALGIGVALGYGLRKEIKSTGEVCRNALLAGIAGAAATAAAQGTQSASQQGQNGGNGNGN